MARIYQKLYRKGPNDPGNHDVMVTHPESDILECEGKWTLGSITMNKASGGDEIPTELFKILKDDAIKVLHSICQQVWKIQQWPRNWKMLVFNPIPKKGNAKECSSYCTIVLISQASKVVLKILQIRFQQEVNQETPDVQVGSKWGLEKAEEPEIKLPVFIGSWQIERGKNGSNDKFYFLGLQNHGPEPPSKSAVISVKDRYVHISWNGGRPRHSHQV